MKRELEGGWFQWIAMPLPALLTIQSGINQLRYATLKGIMAAKKKEIRKVAMPVGPAAHAADPGAGAADAQQADADDRRIAGRGRQGTGAPPARRGEGAVILVVAEQRDGALNRASWEAIAAAQQLSGGLPITVRHARRLGGRRCQELAQADVAEVLVGEHAALSLYTPDAFTMALTGIIERTSPAFVVMAHTYQARDFAPMLAARLRASLLTDVTAISGEGAAATFTRPMFQGKLSATVRPRSSGPAIVTVQIGAFRADAARRGGPAPISPVERGDRHERHPPAA